MERETFPRFSSTLNTQTLTISPTETTSLGCLTNDFDNLEICTKPSSFKPQSTKQPKSTTLRTVPSNCIPGFKSSRLRISLLNTGASNWSLGSLNGAINASRMSFKVYLSMPSVLTSSLRLMVSMSFLISG